MMRVQNRDTKRKYQGKKLDREYMGITRLTPATPRSPRTRPAIKVSAMTTAVTSSADNVPPASIE